MATESRLAIAGSAPVPILFVLDQLWNAGGGTESQFLALLRNLDRRRFEPRVVLLRGENTLSAVVPDVPVSVLGVESLKSLRFLKAAYGLVRRIRRERIGLVQVFFNDSSLALPPFLKWGGARVIVSRRDLGFWYTPGNLRVLRVVRPCVDLVVANCEAVKQVVVERERYAPARVEVVHNGFQERSALVGRAKARRDLGIEERRRVVTVVANLRPLKRIGDAIRAIAQLRAAIPDILLMVVGEDPPHEGAESHGSALRRLVAELDIGAHVTFTGFTPDPMPYIEAADACLLCSETEGLSNSVIEYQWAGRATVATRVGGNSELIDDGVTGFLVDVGDSAAMARHLRVLLTTSGDAIGARAREHALQRFSVESMVRRQQELYARLLGAGVAGVQKSG